MARLGMPLVRIRKALDLPERTFERWREHEPEFREALNAGRDAVNKAMKGLIKRAAGMRVKTTKPMLVPVGGGASEIVDHPTVTYIPPDTAAALAVLKRFEPRIWGDAGRGTTADAKHGTKGATIKIVLDADTAALTGAET
jgi:hypothetical protein